MISDAELNTFLFLNDRQFCNKPFQCFPLMFVLPAMSWHLLGNSFMYATPEKRCDMDRITTCGYDKNGEIIIIEFYNG